ncbi:MULTISPECIES: DUF6879 family protein [Nocardia]|uniref:DUF6879 family protein n=1 Tax=Nocardia TaxID=1817 RepID=UPI0007EB62C3|nr:MULTISPECIES: DUF6879 family protein [Nocardia]MBF6278742.1 hypothetical protein [Nocardia nova]OBA50687.1 hypothetical protein A5789_28465 [Nocardia sp. 852002-51101_SCH5132738]OBB34495.1 hypothetical protein A5748_06575 [Nocardia sp. 852002-51244_SCH5132740]OBF62978.1 hypothetical protein A9X06_10465 [Mycobacterium sp. 852002-51759_SCH5129042]
MQLLHGNPWPELFGDCRREAFHLEVRDAYAVADESAPFRKYLDGEQDDYAWFEPWLQLVKDTTGRGVAVTRVRVVTVPHTDYTRFSLAVTELNAGAGEDIRYLPRHEAGEVPSDDFWLLDDNRVVFNLVDENGRAADGAALTTDTGIVEHCRRLKQRLWSLATPYREYIVR